MAKKNGQNPKQPAQKPTQKLTEAQESTPNNWSEKKPYLRYFGGFIGLMLLFYGLYMSDVFFNFVARPYIQAQTYLSALILNAFGQGTSSDGVQLIGQGASLNVAKGCDGMEVTALYLAAVLLMPFSGKSKLMGVGGGLLVLSFLNLIRIIALYVAQKYWPSSFEFLHLHGGFALFTVVAILMWAYWATWAFSKESNQQPSDVQP